jgi:phytoene/squalene synthetase
MIDPSNVQNGLQVLRDRRTRTPLAEPYAAAEAIASRDNNNLYLTSCFFRDTERYKAFCAFYALMRVVDDRIDDLPDRAMLTESDRRREHDAVAAWEEAVLGCYQGRSQSPVVVQRCGHPDAPALLESLASSLALFSVPRPLWESFFRSMHWDLDHDRFDAWRDFLEYTEGASVSPTAIYLILLASRRSPSTGAFSLSDDFDLAQCGRQLGTFAYLGHIVRDLGVDLRTGRRGLLYFSREDMEAHGVTEAGLFADLAKGEASESVRSLVADLLRRARNYLGRGRSSMAPFHGQIEADCAFVLELIVTMYERVIERIERCDYDPLAGRHRLSGVDKRAIMKDVAGRTRFELPELGAPLPR